jgi:Spy/CpxP family protein refolding chaperone
MMPMIRYSLLAAVLLVLPSASAAQDTATAKGKPTKPPSYAAPREAGVPAFSQHLFPPELIMQNQSQLRITRSQRTAILNEIKKLQETVTPLQLLIAAEAGRLNDLMGRDAVTESEVLSRADRMMNHEVAVKRAQLEMLVRIRNLLTADQREMLRSLRGRE